MPTHVILALILAFTVLQPDETIRRYGGADHVWHLQTLNGAPFTANATLTFPSRNVIAGQAPCNRFNSSNTTPYPWFEATPIVATRRACPELPDEIAFFKALEMATIAVIDGGTLTFSADDTELLVFKALD